MTRKKLAKLWARWKALAPELTNFWWDDNTRTWMGGEMMCCDDVGGRDFHHHFYLGETLPEAAAYIRSEIAKVKS